MKTFLSYLMASFLLAWSSSSGATELVLLALVPNHVGLTTSRSPSLCWIMWGIPSDGATMKFTLSDQSITPPLEVDLPSSFLTENKQTCQCVNLKEYGISLDDDVQYRWFISVARSHESHARDVVAGGMIKRCDFEDCMLICNDRCDVDAVRSFARWGFWYDPISCLCDLIRSNPTDTTLWKHLASLMNQGEPRDPNGGRPYLIPPPTPWEWSPPDVRH